MGELVTVSFLSIVDKTLDPDRVVLSRVDSEDGEFLVEVFVNGVSTEETCADTLDTALAILAGHVARAEPGVCEYGTDHDGEAAEDPDPLEETSVDDVIMMVEDLDSVDSSIREAIIALLEGTKKRAVTH